MWLKRGLKKLSAAQKKLRTKYLAKNGMPNLLAYIYGRIGAVPCVVNKSIKKAVLTSLRRESLNYCLMDTLRTNRGRYPNTWAVLQLSGNGKLRQKLFTWVDSFHKKLSAKYWRKKVIIILEVGV